ncbi:MAG: hypothetical protein HY347_04970 [candidate division NC10 bacterium]|nr:hypothetical protein [candidate division NC10 bacterium]
MMIRPIVVGFFLIPGILQFRGSRYLWGLGFLIPSLYALWNIASSIIGFFSRYYGLVGSSGAELERDLVEFQGYALRFALSTGIYLLGILGSIVEERLSWTRREHG